MADIQKQQQNIDYHQNAIKNLMPQLQQLQQVLQFHQEQIAEAEAVITEEQEKMKEKENAQHSKT